MAISLTLTNCIWITSKLVLMFKSDHKKKPVVVNSKMELNSSTNLNQKEKLTKVNDLILTFVVCQKLKSSEFPKDQKKEGFTQLFCIHITINNTAKAFCSFDAIRCSTYIQKCQIIGNIVEKSFN